MADEDQKLMERIGSLAGQINRHKNQQAGKSATTSYSRPTYHRTFEATQTHGDSPVNNNNNQGATTGYGRGGPASYRGQDSYPYPSRGGYRARNPPPHRHRSLVLNGASALNRTDADTGATSDASTSSWVSKNDRHLQLINSSVFHEQTQARNKAIEETRLHKQRQKDARERNQLINHFNRVANPSVVPANQASAPSYEVNVGGIRFQVTKNGSKLTKLPGDMNSPKATPKMAIVGGIKFYRSKNGNLYRQGIVRAQRRYGGVKKVDVPCKSFSTTGIFLSIPRILSRNKYVARLGHGSCPKGPMCRYVHDPSKVAACKDLLLKGVCASGDSCDLSHQLIPERTPHCVHYAKGNCSNPNCPYTHRVLPSGAPFCRPFGIDGYCEKGISCPGRHSFECPDFSNTGVCKTRGCKLLHRERANFIRKANAAREQASTANDDVDDVSSDDDGESVNSNDVDSEGVEDFMGKEELLGFASQKDFIQF